MTGILQLTEQKSPTAQTFVVDEASVLTGIGIFFHSADPNLPITLELRPTTEGGQPSAKRYVPGSRVVATAAQIGAKAATAFSAATEYKFQFTSPIYVPKNTLLAVCIYSSATGDSYKVYFGENGEFLFGTTTARYNSGVNVSRGSLYASSNGTTWEGDNSKDLTFKVYKAQFDTTTTATAKLQVNVPGKKKLTESLIQNQLADYVYDPLRFTSGDSDLSVLHPAHGFRVGDTVTLSTDATGFDSSSTVNGVKGSSILGQRTITAADPFGYTFKMDSGNATSSIRAGGTGLYATEQNEIDEFMLNVQYSSPIGTAINATGNFTTIGDWQDADTGYDALTNQRASLQNPTLLTEPAVVAARAQEVGKLSGNASTVMTINMNTNDANVAPYFNVNNTRLEPISYFIDHQQDSALAGGTRTDRNYITTVPYVPETAANGGTNASKHISIPYTLSNSSTSIVALVDAVRPIGADFDVWFRTSLSSSGVRLIDQDWTAFTKDIKVTKGNSYNDIPPNDNLLRFVEYEFNVFDLADFDEYQIKITMNAEKSTRFPRFKNLRTIATS